MANESGNGTPRWVIVLGTITLVFIVIFIVVHLAGGGLGMHHPGP